MRSTPRRLVMTLLAALAATAIGGCYERVTSAQGFGADRVNVEKGNLKAEKGTRTLGYPKYQTKSLPGS